MRKFHSLSLCSERGGGGGEREIGGKRQRGRGTEVGETQRERELHPTP